MLDLARMRTPEPFTLVIFGASGDLAFRKLVPALHTLACSGHLPEKFFIVGVARSAMDTDAFRERMREGVQTFGRIGNDACGDWDEFAARLHYMALHYDAASDYEHLAHFLSQIEAEQGMAPNRLYYLSTPPDVYEPVVERLGAAGLAQREGGYARIVVEKPFGHDTASARMLNAQLHRVFEEDQIYRIDHYLGKETVQNIMVFRFANAIFEPIWNRRYIDHVQISVLESVGVERRGGFYDQAGVLRDMFQNHLLQLLSLTAMEPPTAWDATWLRDEKVKILRAVRAPAGENLKRASVRAQYRDDESGVGYRQEEGVAPTSETPTFAALELYVDNWRWQGVPFYLRSGKHLANKVTQVMIQFKEVPHQLFAENARLAPNMLSFCLQPDEGFHLGFQTKQPGAGMRTRPVDMTFHFSATYGQKALPEAYERLLLDALLGDASLFARADEIEHSWRTVDAVLDGWANGDGPELSFYKPGSWGPQASDEMLARAGRAWDVSCVRE